MEGHLATGYWLLITDYWLLATDYWLLTTGYLVSDLSKNVPPRRQTGVGTRRGGPYSSVGPWRGLSRLRRYRVGNCTLVTIWGQGNLSGGAVPLGQRKRAGNSTQLRVFGLGLLQDGNIGIGVLPESEEILVRRAGFIVGGRIFSGIEGVSASQAEAG